MNLIKEIEIAYFRSFYKATLLRCKDLNIIFGKNDSGKSNIVRALNLFFNNITDHQNDYDFAIDFCDERRAESNSSDDIRKFIYVKVTFNTPHNYLRSLGKEFYVKRQWTVSRGNEYIEEFSAHIASNKRHIVTRFLNLIRFIYVPAIKDITIFQSLLNNIYSAISDSDKFKTIVNSFTSQVQDVTKDLFTDLPIDVAAETKISTPNRIGELFETLDFETIPTGGGSPKSLTTQRGDGIKVRHIPEILSFISKYDAFEFHVWGFEEPENSLDFLSAEAEAARFLRISGSEKIQIFITTHSPSFYNIDSDYCEKYYIKNSDSRSVIVQGKKIDSLDVNVEIGDGFYLPAVAKALERYSQQQIFYQLQSKELDALKGEIAKLRGAVLYTEGKTDVAFLEEAWNRLYKDRQRKFIIKSCDTTEGKGGGAAGANKLGLILRAVHSDSQNLVIGLFDRDEEGRKAWVLDANFQGPDLFSDVKKSSNGKAFGLLLPIPESRKKWAECSNLTIEHYFPDECFTKSANTELIKIRLKEFKRKFGDTDVLMSFPDLPQHYEIVSDSKMTFAKNTLQKLPDSAFANFRLIFEQVIAIVG